MWGEPLDVRILAEVPQHGRQNGTVTALAPTAVYLDRIAREGYGLVDLLKTLDSRKRPNRFTEMGLINEPGFRMAGQPDEQAEGCRDPRRSPASTTSAAAGARRGSGLPGRASPPLSNDMTRTGR